MSTNHVLDKWVTQDPPQRRVGPRPCPLTLRVSWLGRKTERLIKRANDAVRLAYPTGEVRAVYRTNRAFRLPKEGLPTHKQSNLIYSFECRQCESRTWGRHSNGLANELSNMYQGTPWIQPASRRRNAVVVHLKSEKTPRKIIRQLLVAIWQQTRSAA